MKHGNEEIGNIGTFYHMWWTCPKVKDFWEKIYNELKKVMKVTFSKKPEAFLLSMTNEEIPSQDRVFFMYATTAARILLARTWKGEEIPTVEEWQMKLMDYMELAELTARIRDQREEKVSQDWKKYKDYLLKCVKLNI